MRVTLKAIARELGINESTVSYALAGNGSINPDTRQKIRETAERLGYVPCLAARQTSTGKSNSIAIVVPNVLAEYGEFCEYAFRSFCEKGYQTQILVTEFSAERELELVRGLIGQNIAGTLLIPAQSPQWEKNGSESINLLISNKIHTVVRNRFPSLNGTSDTASSVNIDYEMIGHGLGERLSRRGCRDIRVAVPHPGPFSENVNGVMRGLAATLGDKAHVQIESTAPEESNSANPPGTNLHYEHQIRELLSGGGVDAGRRLFRRLFQDATPKPDAVICPHEVCALGFLLESETSQILIPESFQLATCQQGVFGRAASKRIAAGFVSQKRLATAMTDKLLKLLNGEKRIQDESLLPEFDDGETLKSL